MEESWQPVRLQAAREREKGGEGEWGKKKVRRRDASCGSGGSSNGGSNVSGSSSRGC